MKGNVKLGKTGGGKVLSHVICGVHVGLVRYEKRAHVIVADSRGMHEWGVFPSRNV